MTERVLFMDKYIETNRIKLDGCTVIINRPVLTDDERAKREQSISESLGRVVADYYTRREA